MQSTRDKGYKGEQIAVDYLVENGYEIKKRNFHFGKSGEIDIVAEKEDELVFVEVKYRTSNTFGDPMESITPRKAKTLRKVSEGYLYVNKIYDKACRIDIIIVDSRSENPIIEHVENAVY